MRRRHALACLALAGATGVAWPLRRALAQLEVDITRGFFEPMPIAISPLAGDTARARELGEQIANVVESDLESSGLFRPVDRRAFIQSPDEMRTLPRFADWRQINAQALVTGHVPSTGSLLEVEFRLWDVFGGSQMIGRRLDTSEDNWRRVAHRIADAVYERLTGETGYFDTRIAYVSESGPATSRIKRLAVMDQDGANHRYLTEGDHLVMTPRFDPGGDHVAFLAYRDRVPRVYLKSLTSGREQLVGDFPGMTFAPRFSPDGRTVAVSLAEGGNSDIHLIELASGRQRRLTRNPAIDTSPGFSPDGRRIVFNSDRAGTPQLYVMGADGSGQQRISFGSGRYSTPVWSPRGDLVAFTKQEGGMFHIGVMRPDGGGERLLTRSWLDEGPSWAPNGRVIAFSRGSQGGGGSHLRAVDITGHHERALRTPMDASDPDWSPTIS
jgi:TolB protein